MDEYYLLPFSGFGMDGNVIYSTASYLPRSLGLNLTLDLFGESLNLLEVIIDI